MTEAESSLLPLACGTALSQTPNKGKKGKK